MQMINHKNGMNQVNAIWAGCYCCLGEKKRNRIDIIVEEISEFLLYHMSSGTKDRAN